MWEKNSWLIYALLAGLSWGTYVPLIFYGGGELTPDRPSAAGRYMAVLCVGLAYFAIAVVFPLGVFLSGQQEWPPLRTTGLVFAALAGVAGAVGAICVILSTSSAVSAATRVGLPKETFKIYIAPLIFGLAPVINTLVSSVWHPKRGAPFAADAFGFHPPGWKLWVGILLVGAGAALVLFSKEEAETKEAAAKKPAAPVAAAPTSTEARP